MSMRPKLITLEGNEDAIQELESMLGYEITEYDLENPELMGGYVAILKKLGKGFNKIGAALGKRRRRKEAGRVESARKRLLSVRASKEFNYKENVEKAKEAARVAWNKQTPKKKNLIMYGVPLALMAYYFYKK